MLKMKTSDLTTLQQKWMTPSTGRGIWSFAATDAEIESRAEKKSISSSALRFDVS